MEPFEGTGFAQACEVEFDEAVLRQHVIGIAFDAVFEKFQDVGFFLSVT
ncbi:MAG: hypothetical protein M3Y80_09765 [Verrucomicrobiota bacterium]|nr:hypothetical protein [Verrucomicrobiota bacterium]